MGAGWPSAWVGARQIVHGERSERLHGNRGEQSLRIFTKLHWTSTLAIVFVLAHVVFLPSTLEDIDSLNFALAIHDFDPTRHQPHPPGYPIFIALAKAARAVVPDDASALALLGALFGALAIFPLMRMYEDLDRWKGRRIQS